MKLVSPKSILFKLAVPIPVVIVISLALAWVLVPRSMSQNAISAASESALQTVNQFKKIRGYYTKYVIADVKGSGTVKPGIDHKDDPSVIPLPATFVHDVSGLLAEEQTTVGLYSAFPFPGRADRELDPFMQEAWDYLVANPEESYQAVEERDGQTFLRVAVSDQMVSQVCVACHNSLASSPKTDWQLGDVRGVVEVRQDITAGLAGAQALTLKLLAGLVVLGLLLTALALWVGRSVVRPIDDICDDMEAIAGGDFLRAVNSSKRGDELGKIGRTLRRVQKDLTKANAAESERLRDQQVQRTVFENLQNGLRNMSQNDFTQPITADFPPEFERLRQDFNQTQETLGATLQQVVHAANNIQGGASGISSASDNLSQRTESQAATLEETAAALDEMTASVSSAADGARNVENAMQKAQGEAQSNHAVVQDAMSAMGDIAESSSQISEIISVIDDIAFQTNLLALNAGVEAARAGEAGRGFAVVASEVRALAQRSSDAAMEIKALISNSSQQVERGVGLVQEAGGALESIISRVSDVSELVSGIASGASEQSTGISEINSGMTQLDQVTQQNAAMVQEASEAGRVLNEQAQQLLLLVSEFKTSATHTTEFALQETAA